MLNQRVFLLLDKPFNDRCYGILYYRYNDKQFRFILKPGYTFDEYPSLIDRAYEKGLNVMMQKDAFRFINARIIPHGRQNIIDIMRSANLRSYDEFGMLMYTQGRATIDDMYLKEIEVQDAICLIKEWYSSIDDKDIDDIVDNLNNATTFVNNNLIDQNRKVLERGNILYDI